MKLLWLFLLACCVQGTLSAQVGFEPGFFISNDGKQVDGLILLPQNERAFTRFKYKLTESAPVQEASIETTQAVEVEGQGRYLRAEVEIETSPTQLNNLSTSRDFQLSPRTVFLETLIGGEISLFAIQENGQPQFFVQRQGEPIQPLRYKRYLEAGALKERTPFRQVLFSQYSCPGEQAESVTQLAYEEKALIRYFKGYLACQDLAYETFRERPKSQFNLVIRPGIRFVQLQIDHEPISWQDERTYQENPTVAAVGVALEWLPPLKGQRWALTLEPTFQSTQIESRAASEIREYEITVSYPSIETLVGIKYYQPISPDIQLFANAGLGFDFYLNADFQETGGPLDTYGAFENGRENYFGGLGLTFKERFSFESRYAFGKDLFFPFPYWSSQYNYFTAILGVRIF